LNKKPRHENENERCRDLELMNESLYSLGKVCQTNQRGSGFGLTVKNSHTDVRATGTSTVGVDHDPETSVTGFHENLVKQVMDHQEGLHKRVLEAIERLEKERTQREEAWRRQETAKYNREAIARANEEAKASTREALILSCMEKITGQSIKLPSKETSFLLQPDISKEPIKEMTPTTINKNSRWPSVEVEALIQASLESKFQEPGPKWKEVSSLMASMGYKRSAQRFKEKWANIHKYF
jgi:hypothetical protein